MVGDALYCKARARPRAAVGLQELDDRETSEVRIARSENKCAGRIDLHNDLGTNVVMIWGDHSALMNVIVSYVRNRAPKLSYRAGLLSGSGDSHGGTPALWSM